MSESKCENILSKEEKKEKVMELKKIIRDNPDLKKFPYEDEAYLERFLGGTNFNVEAAYERIKIYYELLLEFPEWFTKEPPLAKKEIIEKDIRIALSETDKDGRPIYIAKIGNTDPTKMKLLDVIAVDDIWLESILLNFASEKGLCVLIDIANIPWRALRWLTPHNMKVGIKKLQSMPFRDYRFHVVNDSALIQTAIKIVWPFLPEHIKNMVKFHFDDWESLHAFIDPDILPNEYGGRNGMIKYNEIYEQLYTQNEQIFENFRMYRSLKNSNE